ncbi:deoxyribodipyrimidine photo-lyase [Salidesulfovibrio onnuriiensis]|uniref:deoxyribodipyrimidine photo-lyase n=1 Tax=Salidesulfovibrio onnuriiensis TaxID=2583823 RepID=UPI0011CAA44D|nr:deoxyribodipyrimidine photo-lyase [Salidesulfovibrio onnuriiensis]
MPEQRTRQIRQGAQRPGPVVYWMHREHRARDNWALLFAQSLAMERRQPLCVAYALAPGFLEAGRRQFAFLCAGLRETAAELEEKNIPFLLRLGDPPAAIPKLARELGAAALVTDFDALRLKRGWVSDVCSDLDMDIFETDSRNIVPCWTASDKREYAARTMRPKVHRLLPDFLVEPPELLPHPVALEKLPATATWEEVDRFLASRPGPESTAFVPGGAAATRALDTFIKTRLNRYGKGRNVPTDPVVSRLSPYLHFGQISSLRVALSVLAAHADKDSKDSYLEELIVRRELSDNFCYHEPEYDSTRCFADWASTTLAEHADDPRPHLYSDEQLERGLTHDPLWNAAQAEMVRTGHMHGYMRMYWAKKILEWTESPDRAMRVCIALNDRYQLDGRDSNGYTGIAWSIGGVHDRAWKERPVFGKIRYMSFNGAKSKFRIREYIDEHLGNPQKD